MERLRTLKRLIFDPQNRTNILTLGHVKMTALARSQPIKMTASRHLCEDGGTRWRDKHPVVCRDPHIREAVFMASRKPMRVVREA